MYYGMFWLIPCVTFEKNRPDLWRNIVWNISSGFVSLCGASLHRFHSHLLLTRGTVPPHSYFHESPCYLAPFQLLSHQGIRLITVLPLSILVCCIGIRYSFSANLFQDDSTYNWDNCLSLSLVPLNFADAFSKELSAHETNRAYADTDGYEYRYWINSCAGRRWTTKNCQSIIIVVCLLN
jgi:hypothetical protein